jgi:hypothetical protein
MQFYDDDDLTKKEEARVKKTWRQWCRESTRQQVVQAMSDNREIGNTIYEVCHQNLLSRDADDARRNAKSEEITIWAKMTLRNIRRLGKKRNKSGKFLAEVIRLREQAKQVA